MNPTDPRPIAEVDAQIKAENELREAAQRALEIMDRRFHWEGDFVKERYRLRAALSRPVVEQTIPAAQAGQAQGVRTINEARTALRFLANNPRPSGGESTFNSAHLLQLASELESVAGGWHAPAPAVDRGLSEAVAQALEAFTPAIEAIECLQYIRCHPKRHELDREWLTRADKAIGYWEGSRAADRIGKARDALLAALAASAPSQAEPREFRCTRHVDGGWHQCHTHCGFASCNVAPSQAGSCQASGEAS